MLANSSRILSILLLCAGFASAQLTTISGTIQRADGSTPSGSAVISWQQFLTAGGIVVPAGSKQITITNGVVLTSLYPNVPSNPPGTSYSVVYTLTASPVYTRRWYINASASPVPLQQVEFPPAGLVGTTAIVSPSQLTQAAAAIGQCLVWSGTAWMPSTCAGSPGSTSFTNVTSGTNVSAAMILGSGSSLSFTGTGTVNSNQILGTAITGLSGTGGKLLEALGTLNSSRILSADASGNAVDSGIPVANVIVSSGSYADPAWITSLAGSKITGTMTCGQLPAFTGDITKGSGSCATTVTTINGFAVAPSATTDTTNASNISSGTLGSARLPAINLGASGAGGVTGNLQIANFNGGIGASSATAFFGDGTWKSVVAGGTVTNTSGPLTAGAVVVGNGGNDATVVGSLGTTVTLLHGNAGGSPSWSAVSLTADVSGLLPVANGGLNSSSIAFSGPSGGAKTFALPNASATILTSNTPVTLLQGGTGSDLSAIIKGGLIVGTASNTVAVKTVGTDGQVLTADAASTGGVKWAAVVGTGTVTSIATTSPITGGTITTTGTIACATCVTSAAALTANQLLIGGGSQASAGLGSLGTTTTVLHGNAGGAPAFSALSLTADVSGALPIANGGTNATSVITAKDSTHLNIPFVTSSDFDFTPQAPGGSISVGSNTITLVPCPYGVAGAHTVAANLPHLLYLSAGTGTAEAVPITGGTCTSGAASGTIIITAANTHTGAWTVQSATSGIQEAIYVAGVSGVSGITGAVRMPAGSINLYGKTTIPDAYGVSLRGSGMTATTLRTKSTTGDWIVYDYVSTLGYVDLGDFQILDDAGTNHSSGTMIKVRYRVDGLVSNIMVSNAYDAYLMERNARAIWSNINSAHAHYGILVSCNGVSYPTCINEGQIIGGHLTAAASAAQQIRIEAPTSGLTVSEMFTEGGAFTACTSVVLAASGTNPFNELKLVSNIFDGCASGINFVGNSSSYQNNYVMLLDNEINALNTGIQLSNYAQNVTIANSVIGALGSGGTDRAILMGGNARNISISGSSISSDGDAAILTQGVVTGLDIIGNVFGGAAQPTSCLSLGGTTTAVNVRANNFKGNAGAVGCTNIYAGSAGSWAMTNNTGVDDSIPAVASASTVAFPINPTFTITGATAVTAVTLPLTAGSKWTFIATSATPGAWTAGATIGNTFTPTQNRPVNCLSDGTKVSCTP